MTLENEGDLTPDLAQSPGADAAPVADTGANSDAPALEGQPQSSSGQTDQPASADTAEPKSMAEAIEAAMKAAEDGQPPAAEAPKAEPSDNGDPAPEKSDEAVEEDPESDDDPSDEELASFRPATQKRIKKLLSQRNAFRREAEQFRDDATHYRNLRQFQQQADLEDAEMREGLALMAHLKSGDPQRLQVFLQAMMPRINAVMEALGEATPADLREKVEVGEITEEMARNVARERYARAQAEARAARVSQTVQVQQDTARAHAIRTASQRWEESIRLKDADFDKKADAMKRAAQALVAERGLPRTPEEALQYAQAAYDEVNRWFSTLTPAPKPTRKAPASGPSASLTGLSPAPTSLADAIRLGMEQGTRR